MSQDHDFPLIDHYFDKVLRNIYLCWNITLGCKKITDLVIMGPESVVLDQLGFNERFHNLGFPIGLNPSLLNWV